MKKRLSEIRVKTVATDQDGPESPDQTPVRLKGLKALYEHSLELLRELDQRKCTKGEEAEVNLLGEKVELQMITEEENAERTFLSMQSTSSDELV